MAKFAGKSLAVQLADSGGTLRLISTAVSVASVDGTSDTPEVTGGGATQKSYVVGLEDGRVTLEGPVDDQANGQHVVMSGLKGGTTGYEIRISPRGTTAGQIQLKGTVLQSNYSPNFDVGDAARYRAEYVPFDNQIGLVWSTI